MFCSHNSIRRFFSSNFLINSGFQIHVTVPSLSIIILLLFSRYAKIILNVRHSIFLGSFLNISPGVCSPEFSSMKSSTIRTVSSCGALPITSPKFLLNSFMY